jgi:peptidoglycan lytic transglycosylase G
MALEIQCRHAVMLRNFKKRVCLKNGSRSGDWKADIVSGVTFCRRICHLLKKCVWVISVVCVGVVSASIYLYFDLMRYARTPAADKAPEIVVMVPQGQGFKTIAENLVAAGVLKYPVLFRAYARIKDYDKKIKAGEYLLSRSMSPDKILQILIDGRIRLHKVTIPEGYTQDQIAKSLETSGLTTAADFLKTAADLNFIRTQGIGAGSFEGYLFPETYFFPRSVTPEKIISAMVSRFREASLPGWEERAKSFGFTPHEVVTLASIIEKETGIPAERPIIASVFHNRIRKKMRLESDPTVIYGIKDFDGNLTRKHLKTHSPYNTYRIKGLPHGPIANPGSEAIRAALYPAQTEYLYFVAKRDRTHQFSTTLSAHNRAVRKYQLRK